MLELPEGVRDGLRGTRTAQTIQRSSCSSKGGQCELSLMDVEFEMDVWFPKIVKNGAVIYGSLVVGLNLQENEGLSCST